MNISFVLEKPAAVSLNIYGLNGRLVESLCAQKMTEGKHLCTWDASGVQAGIYFYHLLANGRVASGMLSVVK